MRFLLEISFVVMASLIAGCATILNIEGEKEVYGGVKIAPSMVADGLSTGQGNLNLLVGSALLFDLPLSLVGDTLTLPITVFSAAHPSVTLIEQMPLRRENSWSDNQPKLQPPVEAVPSQNETQLVLPALSATTPYQ
jgi:uncharacterized protein YceK